jgi:hypothetical protein
MAEKIYIRDISGGIVCDGDEESIFVRGLPEMNIGDICTGKGFLIAGGSRG